MSILYNRIPQLLQKYVSRFLFQILAPTMRQRFSTEVQIQYKNENRIYSKKLRLHSHVSVGNLTVRGTYHVKASDRPARRECGRA